MDLVVVILAAGKGTRMRSALPKVLHPLAGKPLLGHVIDRAKTLNPKKIVVVYGHGGEIVPETIVDESLAWALQEKQLGTGHAVEQAMPHCADTDTVLVLYGDVPLTTTLTLEQVLQGVNETSPLALLTALLDDPTGYGRIIRDSKNEITRIVEQKDASQSELAVNEINTGILACRGAELKHWLAKLDSNNAQGEFYLTDITGLCVADGKQVNSHSTHSLWEILGVNNKLQLADLERQHQLNIARQLMTDGVTILDPARIDVRGELNCGQDCMIDVNTVFMGKVSLENDVYIGPNCVLKDCHIAAHTHVAANSVIEQARVGASCRVGPFARIRPGTELAESCHVGNFVELKNARVSASSKINHLSYVGDAQVGKNVNIGAGTITCNYDGANKYQTIIEDDVFVGSDTQLIAPVTIKKGSTIGAGSTITKDTSEGKLTLSRSKQITIDNWQRPVKNKK